MKESLAIAHAIKRKNHGAKVGGDRSEMIKNIIAKKMNCGGMVKKYSKGGEVAESEENMNDEWYDADFLSDEEDTPTENHTYPDPDGVESTEGMGKMGMMAAIMERIRKKHMGR